MFFRGYKLMSFLPNLFAHRPHVAEHDFTGVVVNPGSSNYKVGDAVFGFIPPRKCQIPAATWAMHSRQC